MAHKQPDITRQRLLETAFREMHLNGFRAASLDHILKGAGVTKGALYHHFPNKKAIGLAVVDELVTEWIREIWIRPLRKPGDPIERLVEAMERFAAEATEEKVRLGCPLNNLSQEMATVDESFRIHLEAVFEEWRSALTELLARGVREGSIRREVDPPTTSAFIVAAVEGAICSAKTSRDPKLVGRLLNGLRDYLQSLHAPRATAGARKARTRTS